MESTLNAQIIRENGKKSRFREVNKKQDYFFVFLAYRGSFRLKGGNGEIIAVSEAYASKEATADSGMESVKKNAHTAKVVKMKEKYSKFLNLLVFSLLF